MSTRAFVATLALAAVALVLLLAAVVFLGEPQRLGGPPPRFHPRDIAYLGLPLLLFAAAASLPLRSLRRQRRR